jgi:DNA mismatch repair ATPase MutS
MNATDLSAHHRDGAIPAPEADFPDTLLFYRMGDFYEMFYHDAERAAACWTSRSPRAAVGRPADPMAGVPSIGGWLSGA